MAEHDESDQQGQLEGFSRREYFRVRTRIALRTRALRHEEADRLRLDIADRKPSDEPTLDPRLRLWLERIERKLDEVRAQLNPEIERPLGSADMQSIEISGSGLAWNGPPDYAEDTWIRVEFELPPPIATHVIVLALAKARLRDSDGVDTQAVAFEAIYEGDRDDIVRHCLDVERRNIQIESGKPS